MGNRSYGTLLMGSIRDYLGLMQYKIVALLVMSAIAGFAIAYAGAPGALQAILLLAIAITASSAGGELLNKILEIDLDRQMKRTSRRASVTGRVDARIAVAYGLSLAALGVIAAYAIDMLAAVMVLLGLVFYIIVYTLLLKRRSRLNIVIGGLAGSFCVWAGVAAASGTVTLPGFLLGLVVLFWIPGHIWSFAMKYRSDYHGAGVPMLTAVAKARNGALAIALFNIAMALVSLSLVLFLGIYYAAIIAIPMAIVLYLSAKTIMEDKAAWTLFKFSSVYLAFVFIGILVAVLV